MRVAVTAPPLLLKRVTNPALAVTRAKPKGRYAPSVAAAVPGSAGGVSVQAVASVAAMVTIARE